LLYLPAALAAGVFLRRKKMGNIYVIQGPHDRGKSETIKNVYCELIEKYKDAMVKNFLPEDISESCQKNNIKVIISNVLGHTIGIESEGDPDSRLKESLKDFEANKCDIIFCATRPRSNTVKWINSYGNTYKIQYIKQIKSNQANQTKNNLDMAKHLIQIAGL
jgi:hypothetical protein